MLPTKTDVIQVIDNLQYKSDIHSPPNHQTEQTIHAEKVLIAINPQQLQQLYYSVTLQ